MNRNIDPGCTFLTSLTLSARETKTNDYLNSADPDERLLTSRLIRIYTACYSFLDLGLTSLLSISVQIQRRNSPLQKLRGEMGNMTYDHLVQTVVYSYCFF